MPPRNALESASYLYDLGPGAGEEESCDKGHGDVGGAMDMCAGCLVATASRAGVEAKLSNSTLTVQTLTCPRHPKRCREGTGPCPTGRHAAQRREHRGSPSWTRSPPWHLRWPILQMRPGKAGGPCGAPWGPGHRLQPGRPRGQRCPPQGTAEAPVQAPGVCSC